MESPMFVFDQYLGKAELSQLAEQWERLPDDGSTKNNIAGVFNREHSDEFYRGMAAALHASAKLLTDKNYPEYAKPTVIIGALGFVSGKLATGKWPTP